MGDGLVDTAWWRGRQDAYLTVATSVWHPGSPLNVIEHLERRRRDPNHAVDVAALDAAALERWFVRVDHWKDCADFDILRLLTLWYGYRDDLPEPLTAALAARFTSFKYWYTEPTPADVVDQRWYWSENHRLIFHTIEYLAGQAFPAALFTSDGTPGAAHRATAAARLSAWFDEKARYGFSEWHSDVYYEKDLAPLLTLAEWADDPALAERAAAFLDLLLFDIALHVRKGNMGVTHGRSYMKEKSRARDQPVFGAVKLCFDSTDVPWVPDDGDAADLLPRNEGAALLARAARYRPPEVVRRVATHAGVMVDREGMGLAIDPAEVLTEHPVRADGLSYHDPGMVAFWWDRSALTPWQLVPLTLDTMDRHRLWDADLFAPLRNARDATGGDREAFRRLAHALAPVVNAGLLTEVNTITYRSAHVMLSTAQSYRPGCAGYQHHIWQATLDADAIVFTTHPANEPLADPHTFRDPDHYWTGSATLPRSAQHGPAAIHIYAAAFTSPALPALAPFAYLDYTHAYFPAERFDEVVRDGHWTAGRRDDGYVALWSWRPVCWREHDPGSTHTNGLVGPFDLVAEGGAANVWIVEVGDADHWGDFTAFRHAVAGARVEVTDLGPNDDETHRGFAVTYASPGAGVLAFSRTGPLTVDGAEVPITDYPRFENPWARVPRGGTTVRIRDGNWSLHLDLATGTRRPAGPQALDRTPTPR